MATLNDNDAIRISREELDATAAPVDLPLDSMVSYDPARTFDSGATLARPLEEMPGEEQTRQPLGGRFALQKPIGLGGFGEVWEAQQLDLQRVVAIKRLRKDVLLKADLPAAPGSRKMTDGRQIRAAFRQEVLTAAHLEHPNILPVHDLGIDSDGEWMMAMKRIHGKPWDALLYADADALSTEDFLARHLPIFVQVCQAVAFAHSRGVLHRDLKPTQVMVGDFGEVLLSDWGLAVVFDKIAVRGSEDAIPLEDLPSLTTATSPAGTPAFMAPEQTDRDASALGPWTDVYLLAGTLYYLLTLRPPHEGKNGRESFQRARLGYVTPPERRTERRVPPELSRITMAALDANPAKRTRSVVEFLAQVQDCLSGAGLRRDSQELANAVRGELCNENDYEHFAHLLAKLARAEALWPGNLDIPPLREQVQSLYSQAALAHGDLALARLQARNVSDENIRRSLDENIEMVAVRQARRDRDRRLATVLAATLFVVIAAVSGLYNMRLAEERNAIAEARDSAHRMVNGVVQNLAQSDETSEPQREAMERLVAYYDAVRTNEMTVDMRLQRMKALQALVRASTAQGLVEQAGRHTARFESEAAALYRAHPNSAQVLEELATAKLLQGVESFRAGQHDALAKAVLESLALNLRLIAMSQTNVASTTPSDMLRMAEALEGEKAPRLDTLLSTPVVSLSLDLIERAAVERASVGMSVAHTMKAHSAALHSRGNEVAAIDALQRGLNLARAAATSKQTPIPETALLVEELSLRLGGMLASRHRTAEARRLLDQAMDSARKRTVGEPAQQLANDHPAGYLSMGRLLAAEGSHAEALREMERALIVLRQRADRSPANTHVREQLFEGEQLAATVAHEHQNWSAAAAAFLRAADAMDVIRLHRADASWEQQAEDFHNRMTQFADDAVAADELDAAALVRGRLLGRE